MKTILNHIASNVPSQFIALFICENSFYLAWEETCPCGQSICETITKARNVSMKEPAALLALWTAVSIEVLTLANG